MRDFRLPKRIIRGLSVLLLGMSVTIAIAACSGRIGNPNTVTLTLVSYMVTPSAYQEIIPNFTQAWNQTHDRKVIIQQSYGPSGSQTRTVLHGLDADIVALALALDIKQLEKAGLIESGWEKEAPNNGIVTRSVTTIVTRDGNPKGIQTWSDLAKENVRVVMANPKTSGGARWSFLALWGSVTQTGGTPEDAIAFTGKVFQNAPVLSEDSREATDAFFQQGQGDALINYENEVILAGLHDRKRPYIVPDVNIAIENAVALVDRNVEKHGNREVAEAFLKYLFTPEAQRAFAKVGFRPVDPTVAREFANQYPPIDLLFTVEDLGGWDTVQQRFFADGAIVDQFQANIQR